jgi:serine/threonine protein kinase
VRRLQSFVKELIVWAHASHPNVLLFYGVFVDEFKRICLVSPFMTKGNLRDYAPRLPQKNRIPLVCDYPFNNTGRSFTAQAL